MIPRLLVPRDARPPADATTSRRRPTDLDERTLVPSMLPVVPLSGQSNIPANLPLESIAERVVVPRDVNRTAMSVQEDNSLPLQPTQLDERIAVPVGAAPPEIIAPPENLALSQAVVNPDVFMTGEVHFVAEQPVDSTPTWQLVTRISSIALHILVIVFILSLPKLFPPHQPTDAEIARINKTLLLPPGLFTQPAPRAARPAPPPVNVDPRILRRVAPVPIPAPTPPPPTPQPQPKELPAAPTPKVDPAPVQPSAPTPKPDAPKPGLKLETPDAPQPKPNLILPKSSSNSLQQSLKDLPRNQDSSGGRTGGVIGPMPKTPTSPGSPGGGSQGQGTYGNGYEILTPTEGVDFSDYMKRVIASVRRNWYAVMPESAMLGDQGRVALQFRIMQDGSVPTGEPVRLIGSGKEPLDRAAVSAIRSSNPFEPLPPAFKGPYIELRFYFLYNLPLEAAYQ